MARRATRRSSAPASPGARSTCSSRTRPTCASSRRRPSTPAFPMEKVIVNVDRYGNTSSASIPLALDQAIAEGRVGPGIADHAGRLRRRLHLGERRRPVVTVVLFPGQGAQRVGMGKDLADRFPAARDTFGAIDDALGVPLSRLMWEGPENELTLTHNAQPAILAHTTAVLAVVAERLGDGGRGRGAQPRRVQRVRRRARAHRGRRGAARPAPRRADARGRTGAARRDGGGARDSPRPRWRPPATRPRTTAASRSPPTSTRPTRP